MSTAEKLAFAGVVLTGLIAIWNNRVNVRQKAETDAREAWWKRSQWAMERAADDNPVNQAVGLVVLNSQRLSSLARREDSNLMVSVSVAFLNKGKP